MDGGGTATTETSNDEEIEVPIDEHIGEMEYVRDHLVAFFTILVKHDLKSLPDNDHIFSHTMQEVIELANKGKVLGLQDSFMVEDTARNYATVCNWLRRELSGNWVDFTSHQLFLLSQVVDSVPIAWACKSLSTLCKDTLAGLPSTSATAGRHGTRSQARPENMKEMIGVLNLKYEGSPYDLGGLSLQAFQKCRTCREIVDTVASMNNPILLGPWIKAAYHKPKVTSPIAPPPSQAQTQPSVEGIQSSLQPLVGLDPLLLQERLDKLIATAVQKKFDEWKDNEPLLPSRSTPKKVRRETLFTESLSTIPDCDPFYLERTPTPPEVAKLARENSIRIAKMSKENSARAARKVASIVEPPAPRLEELLPQYSDGTQMASALTNDESRAFLYGLGQHIAAVGLTAIAFINYKLTDRRQRDSAFQDIFDAVISSCTERRMDRAEYFTNLPMSSFEHQTSTSDIHIDGPVFLLYLPGRRSAWELQGVPYVTTGDGDCLFNSLSIALYGHEKFAQTIKYRVVVYLVEHGHNLQDRVSEEEAQDVTDSERQQVVWDCIVPGMYHGVRSIIACAYALNITIQVLYPQFDNGPLYDGKTYEQTYNVPKPGSSSQPPFLVVTIMWTGPARPTRANFGRGLQEDQVFRVNHFVSIIPFAQGWTHDGKMQLLQKKAPKNYQNKFSGYIKEPTKKKVQSEVLPISVSDGEEKRDKVEPAGEEVAAKEVPAEEVDTVLESGGAEGLDFSQPDDAEADEAEELDCSPLKKTLDFDETIELGSNYLPGENPAMKVSIHRFECVEAMTRLEETPAHEELDDIPPGFHSNTHFVSKDLYTKQREREDKQAAAEAASAAFKGKDQVKIPWSKEAQVKNFGGRQYYRDEEEMKDDLLSRVRVSRPDSYGMMKGRQTTKYVFVWKRDLDEGWTDHKCSSKASRESLTRDSQARVEKEAKASGLPWLLVKTCINTREQPKKMTLLTRQIFEVVESSTHPQCNSLHRCVVVQYFGQLPEEMLINEQKGPHCKTLWQLAKMVKHLTRTKSTHVAFGKSLKSEGVEGAASLKEMQRLKDAEKARANRGTVKKGSADLSKDVPKSLDYLGSAEYPHVMHFSMGSDRLPIILLRSKKQLRNAARFCSLEYEKAGVLAIDKTFNVGPFFLTTVAFQHPWLLKRTTRKHPIFLVAIMIHRQSTAKVFAHFLRELQEEMRLHSSGRVAMVLESTDANEEELREQIIYGSDEEKAIMKALAEVNRGGEMMLCVLHLKKSLQRYLARHASALHQTKSEQSNFVNIIFGKAEEHPDALLAATTTAEFGRRRQVILQDLEEVQEWGSQHMSHMRRLLEDIHNKVWRPSIKVLGMSHPNWTTNGIESLNNMLKIDIQRKPLKNLTDMVELCNFQLELFDSSERQAIHDTGNYQLIPELQKRVGVKDVAWVLKKGSAGQAFKQAKLEEYYSLRLKKKPARPAHATGEGNDEEGEEEEEEGEEGVKPAPYAFPEHKLKTAIKPGSKRRVAATRTRGFKRASLGRGRGRSIDRTTSRSPSRTPSPDTELSKLPPPTTKLSLSRPKKTTMAKDERKKPGNLLSLFIVIQ